jgi:F-type H+-transporting ATPase subunit b
MLNTQWGLMVWTLITFGISVWVLWKYAFGPLQKIIDQRRAQIDDSMAAAEGARAEAARLLEEYKETLAKVRAEAEEILERSHTSGNAAKAEILAEAKQLAERTVDKARQQIERDTRSAMQEIKLQVADLTLLAAEKVAGRSLTDADHERLIQEALAELDFDELGMGSKG